MSNPETITINDTKYVRADCVAAAPTGPREVVIADRGWTFYGDVTKETDEYIQLDDGGVVRSYRRIGLTGACKDPVGAEVKVDPGGRLRVRKASIIARIPVASGWMS